MAIYLSRKKGGVTPPSITPSNSSPAALTANSAVTPTANGYAIESYSSVTPSNSSPVTLTSGDIVKLGGNGKAVASMTDMMPTSAGPQSVDQGIIYKMLGNGYVVETINGVSPSDSNPPKLDYGMVYIPADGDGYLCEHAPTSVTPSNANPVHISNLELFYSTLNGTLIDSLTNITPSDSSPVTLSSGSIYKMSGAGKAVASVTDKTPSDSSPASVSSGEIIKASASGYLYATQQPKCKVGTVTNSSSSTANVSVTLGFTPKYLCVAYANSVVLVYDERHSTTKFYRCASTPSFDGQYSFNQTSGNTIYSIDTNGFTIRSSAGREWNYFAIG